MQQWMGEKMIKRTIKDLTDEELISERDRLYRKKYEEGFTQEDDEMLRAVMQELGPTVDDMAERYL